MWEDINLEMARTIRLAQAGAVARIQQRNEGRDCYDCGHPRHTAADCILSHNRAEMPLDMLPDVG